MRSLLFALLVGGSTLGLTFVPAHGDDEVISPKALAAIKKATVFIRSESTEGKTKDLAVSGSGFVVKKDADGVLIVTNLHVIEPKLEIDVAQRITTPIGPGPQPPRPGPPTPQPPRPGVPPTTGRPIPGRPQPGLPPRPTPPQPTVPRPSGPPQPQQTVTRTVWRSMVLSIKNMKIDVVFDSGNPGNEQVGKAEVVAMDPDNDLAILRVKGLKNVPEPITSDKLPELIETARVYVFGFPFGKQLAEEGGNPAITVGQSSISSLRNDSNGELAIVQLNGGINPGNSGGPIVNTAGQLVGIAVKGGSGIGIAIPATQLTKTLSGHVGDVNLHRSIGAKDQSIAVEVGLVDPLSKIKSVTLHYLPADKMSPDELKKVKTLAGMDGVKSLDLTLEKQLASGNLTLDNPNGEVLLQAAFTAADGKEHRSKTVSKRPQVKR